MALRTFAMSLMGIRTVVASHLLLPYCLLIPDHNLKTWKLELFNLLNRKLHYCVIIFPY